MERARVAGPRTSSSSSSARGAAGSSSTSASPPASARPTACSRRPTRSQKRGVDVVRRLRRDARPRRDRGADRRASKSCRAASIEYRGAPRRGDGPRRGARAHARRSRSSTRSRTPTSPGSRNAQALPGRLELLDAGINVICAFNIQHLESLKDLVERATGGRDPRDRARQLPEAGRPGGQPRPGRRGSARAAARRQDLRRREGRVGAASTSSRRRTCRRCASWRCARWPRASAARRSDRRRESDRRAARRERARDGLHLVATRRAPRRCCAAARAWPAGSTPTGTWSTSRRPSEAPDRIDAEAQRHLHANIEKARELGAEVVRLQGRDPVAALLDFARSHAVGHILIGRSHRPWWRTPSRRDFVQRMVREADGLRRPHRGLARARRSGT